MLFAFFSLCRMFSCVARARLFLLFNFHIQSNVFWALLHIIYIIYIKPSLNILLVDCIFLCTISLSCCLIPRLFVAGPVCLSSIGVFHSNFRLYFGQFWTFDKISALIRCIIVYCSILFVCLLCNGVQPICIQKICIYIIMNCSTDVFEWNCRRISPIFWLSSCNK